MIKRDKWTGQGDDTIKVYYDASWSVRKYTSHLLKGQSFVHATKGLLVDARVASKKVEINVCDVFINAWWKHGVEEDEAHMKRSSLTYVTSQRPEKQASPSATGTVDHIVHTKLQERKKHGAGHINQLLDRLATTK